MTANLLSNGFAAFQQHAFLTIGSEVLIGIALLGALTYAVSKKPERADKKTSSASSGAG
jgi:predicted transporter